MYKILVADDEEKIRALIRKYAEFEGHTVTEASNGMEAVRLWCRKRFRYHRDGRYDAGA